MQTDWTRQSLTVEGELITKDRVKSMLDAETGALPQYMSDLYAFLDEWFDERDYVTVQTSGSTGVPKTMHVSKEKMMGSAAITCRHLGLKAGDTALLCMNLRYIGAKMMVVRAILWGMNLIVREVSGHPFAGLGLKINFAAVVPMQMYNSFSTSEEVENLSSTDIVIIGGGAISAELLSMVKDLPCKIYSTYGMTETLSHIALRKLNGSDASDFYYPLGGVGLSVSGEGTLDIHAPVVCDEVVRTNDIVEMNADGGFVVLGRKDNVINSGGIKISPEKVESMLSAVVDCPVVITSVPDRKFGESVVCMLQENSPLSEDIKVRINDALPAYYRPKHFVSVEKIPLTENGKIARLECRELARKILGC